MLQWMDDFTSYGTDASNVSRMLNGPYAEANSVGLVADPDPTAGGQFVLGMQANFGSTFRKVLTSGQTTVGVAFRMWLSALPADSATSTTPFWFNDQNNSTHCYVRVDSSGYLLVYRVDSGGDVLIAQSSSPVIIANAWRHLECKIVLDVAAGSVEIRLEGATTVHVTGIRTTSNIVGMVASIQNVRFRNGLVGSGGNIMYIKDFIIWDGSGSINNTFMGTCQVYKIIPDGDVSLGWTPSAGTTGYNLINETTPDDDSEYIEAPFPVPSPSEFTLSDLPDNVTAVKGVMSIHRSRKTDGGDGQVQVSLISGANTGNGADRTITTAYTYWWDMFDQDPGGTNWSKALVDALHLKLNRTV